MVSLKTTHATVLHVDVEASVAGILQHVTPGVVGVIVGAAQFDICDLVQLVLVVPVVATSAAGSAKCTGLLLLPLGPGTLVAAAHTARFVGLEVGQAVLPVLAFDGFTCGGLDAPSPVRHRNGPAREAGLSLQFAHAPVGDAVGAADQRLG